MATIRILILAIIATACYLGQAQDDFTFRLPSDNSYALKYTLSRNYKNKIRYEYEVDEIYSSWQKRTRIKFRQTKRWFYHGFKNYQKFIDAMLYADENEVIRLDSGETQCTSEFSESFDYFFNYNLLKTFESKPFIGLSKFFMFAQKNNHELGGDDDNFFDITEILKDADSNKFIKYTYRPSAISSFTMFYHENESENLPFKIPVYLGSRITDPEGNFDIHYVVKRFEIIPDEPEYSSLDGLARPHSLGGKSVALDRLAIKPAIGCGNAMKPVESIAHELSVTGTEHFSFKASLTSDARGEPIEIAVGYESSIATLRSEQRIGDKLTSTLVNYHTGTIYNIIERSGDEDAIMEQNDPNKDPTDNDVSCIMALAPKGADKFSLGDMLLGTNNFVYLGAALVRGIETRVYESFNTTWPLWFQQPAIYHSTNDWITAANKIDIRPSKSMQDDRILNTVIYVSNPTNDHKLLSSKLLRIEIYKLNRFNLRVEDKYNFDIFEFSWKLSGDSANGLSMEQFFSLGDTCSSSEADDNHYGQIDMMLEGWPLASEKVNPDWLQETTRRNFAILRMMQEMGQMPAHMIYDIDSRFKKLPAPAYSAIQSILKIQATFRVAQHTRNLVQLLYIGRGEMLDSASGKFSSFIASTFQICYYIAAHRKVDTVFAFDTKRTICSIYNGDLAGSTRSLIKESFEIAKNDEAKKDDEGSQEVYRVKHVDHFVARLSDELTSMIHGKFKDTLDLADPRCQEESIEFALKSFQMTEIDEKNPYELDDIVFSDTNKFLGFGLVLGDKQNRAIVAPSRQQSSDNDASDKFGYLDTDVSFGQCRAECLANLECRSFSVCVRNAKIECIISTVDFGAVNMVLQLMLAKDRKTKLGEQMSLDIDENEKIQVKKFPSCELHNKIHKDLFAPMKLVTADALSFSSHGVTTREQCAKLCIDKTIQVLKHDVQMAHEASYAALNHPESDVATIRKLSKEFTWAHREVCDSFFYLDKHRVDLLSKSVKDIIEKNVISNDRDGPVESYCQLGRHSSKIVDSGARRLLSDEQRGMKVEEYAFDFSFMFERHQGTSLRWSKMEPEVEEALNQIMWHQVGEQSDNAYKIMKRFLDMGGNVGTWRIENAEECARLCLMQSVTMWPGCKSFDVIESTRHQMTYCYFNAITMRDALHSERFDLISNDPKDETRLPNLKNFRIAHYEPKPGFIASSLDIANQLEIAEGYVDSIPQSQGFTITIGHFGMFITVTVALLIGIVLGITVGRRLSNTNEQKVEDNEKLVERPVVEFSNFVNFEGEIRDGMQDKAQQ